ncbi:MAG: hypothetical protein JWP37_2317 [Mucilaginibacter sp.]|nr:hypothetical protein [Mucilaginibacter sp.]
MNGMAISILSLLNTILPFYNFELLYCEVFKKFAEYSFVYEKSFFKQHW